MRVFPTYHLNKALGHKKGVLSSEHSHLKRLYLYRY